MLPLHQICHRFGEFNNPQKIASKLKDYIALITILDFCIFIEFIGVRLVNKIKRVSGAQFYSTSSMHIVVCVHPSKNLFITMYPGFTLLCPVHPFSPWQLAWFHPCLWVFSLFLFGQSLHPTPSSPLYPCTNSCPSALCLGACRYTAC